MKATATICAALMAAASLRAAVIEQVIVRQQWPWSTDVKVAPVTLRVMTQARWIVCMNRL